MALRISPLGGGAVQRGKLASRGAPQLELQQVREQPVVAKPRPPRVQRDHERVGLLQVLGIRSPPEPPVSRSASGPFTRSSTEVRSSSRLTSSG
jgi:hypothetical protein